MILLTEQVIKEQLSRAYTESISAYAGIMCSKPQYDYGIDGTFQDVEYDAVYKRYSETGFGIDFQLKASVNVTNKKGYIIYDLEVKNYRDLIKTKIGTPRILILYSLPRDRSTWIEHLSDGMIMRKCAWWCSLKGMNDVNNKEKIRITIPENQILTSSELIRLMSKVKGGADL